MRTFQRTNFIGAALLCALFHQVATADNNCLNFQPQQYGCVIANADAIPERNITIEFWFRTRANGGLFSVTASDPGVRDHDRGVTIQNGNIYHYLWANREGSETINTQGINFADGNWHHFAIVLEENRGQNMYIDGVRRAQGQLSHSLFDWADRFVLGYGMGPNGQQWLNGDLDEFRYWNAPLTPEQIQERMGVALVGDEQNLIFYYRMDEGQGASVADDSPNNFPMRFGSAAGQDQYDPRWGNPGAPVSGAIAGFDTESLQFRPIGPEQSTSIDVVLRNLAEQNDAVHRLTFDFSDLGGAPRWISIDPAEGEIDAGAERVITFTAASDGVEPGDYERDLRLVSNARDFLQFDFPARLTVTEGIGTVSGLVYDAATDQPIAGAIVKAIADFDLMAITDENGRFAFADLAVFPYTLLITAADYLPLTSNEINFENGEEVDLDFALLHSRMRPESESVELSLQSDDSLTASLALNNPGNGPLTWSAALDFPDELELDPWSLRQDYPVGAITEDDRIQAVTYAEGEIYLAGSADQQKRIYVMNHDGELQRSFGQLSPSRYGFSGLTWDGELLWGAADPVIYGFNTAGDSVTSFESPLNPANNVVWDNDRGLFWLSSITSNILGCDREGNLVTTLQRRGMRVYGLGYYPEDPDGHQIYVLTNPSGTTQIVMKLDIADSDTMRAFVIPDEGGRPAGCAITNQFDPYSWVFLGVNNVADADMLNVFHLSANTGWIAMLAEEGVVEPGGSEEFLLHFDTEGLQPDLVYETLIRFNHDGVGGVTEVPVSLTITGEGGLTQRNLSLGFGWNLVSVNLTPQVGEEGGSGFVDVVQPLVDAGALIFAKDGAGNFYRPDAGFDGIGEWIGTSGYWLKVNRAAELRVPGVGIGAGLPIELSQGWNTVSYLPRAPMEAPEALAVLGESLILARDGSGRFYLPAYGYSDMGRLREGFGYQVKVSESGELVYGGGERVAGLPTRRYAKADLAWLEELPRTGRMHHLLVKSSLPEGTRLEALTEAGIVAGRGVVGEDGLAGVTLWGDDAETREIEGFVEGEENGRWKMENGATFLAPSLVAGEMAFTDGGWGVVELEGSAVPVEFGLTSLYPNPFNSTLKISFSLPGFGEAGLRVYDLAGREVAKFDGKWKMENGTEHSVTWNAEGLASGVYVVRLEAAGEVATRKVVLVK